MLKVDQLLFPINHRFANQYRLLEALAKLGNPQLTVPTINVVGTNGKGSVSHGVATGLKQKYRRVGLFISPAFLYHNERIQINNQPIADEDLLAILAKIKSLIDEFNLTFFEIWTLIMIVYFSEQKVDIAVIEAGIGGLHDSTKVMSNQVLSLLTRVDLDHQEILGETVEEILQQKMGIAQPMTKMIVSSDNNYLHALIEREGQEKQLKIVWSTSISDPIKYQSGNKGLIKTALDYFDCNLSREAIEWPLGRFTILKNKPMLVLDGAHNLNGIKELINSIKAYQIDKPLILYASSAQKDYDHIIPLLTESFGLDNLYLASFEHHKAWHPKNSYKKLIDWKAFLSQESNRERNIIICGSLYFIPLVYEWLKMKEKHDILLNQ